MAYWILATYTRPNTGVSWFTPSDEIMAKVNEYKDSDPAKITHYEVKESGDQLKQYIKIGFSDQAESLNFLAEDVVQNNESARQSYIDSNPTTVIIEDREETETHSPPPQHNKNLPSRPRRFSQLKIAVKKQLTVILRNCSRHKKNIY